jgi:dihydroflavonol-4-reductase
MTTSGRYPGPQVRFWEPSRGSVKIVAGKIQMPSTTQLRDRSASATNGKVLVTGASGLLGQHLVRQLLERGHQVRALVRAGWQSGILPESVELVKGDIRSAGDVSAAVAGCRFVFHACCTHVYNLPPKEVWAVNVEGTRNVCDAVQTGGCEKLVFTSTISTFKPVPGLFTPDSAMPARLRNTATKQVAEELVLDRVRAGVFAVVVNPSYFVGPYDYQPSPFRLWFPLAVITRIRLVPRGGFNIVSAADVAATHLWALEHGIAGERYPVSGDNISLANFAAMVNMAVGRPGAPKIVPDSFLRLLARGRVFDAYVAQMLGRLNYIDAISPVPHQPLDQLVEQTVRWFSVSSPLVHPWALARYVWKRYV